MAKKHYDLSRLARAKAMDDWGVEATGKKEAIRSLDATRVSEAALLELVRRLNQAIGAWSKDKDLEDEYDPDKPPDYVTPFPDIHVGDVLYDCEDLDYGVDKRVVIDKDEEGYIRTVCLNATPQGGRVYVGWGDEDDSQTPEEAVARAAKRDIDYHGPRARRAERILEAIRNKENFEHLLGDPDELEGQ